MAGTTGLVDFFPEAPFWAFAVLLGGAIADGLIKNDAGSWRAWGDRKVSSPIKIRRSATKEGGMWKACAGS